MRQLKINDIMTIKAELCHLENLCQWAEVHYIFDVKWRISNIKIFTYIYNVSTIGFFEEK